MASKKCKPTSKEIVEKLKEKSSLSLSVCDSNFIFEEYYELRGNPLRELDAKKDLDRRN